MRKMYQNFIDVLEAAELMPRGVSGLLGVGFTLAIFIGWLVIMPW